MDLKTQNIDNLMANGQHERRLNGRSVYDKDGSLIACDLPQVAEGDTVMVAVIPEGKEESETHIFRRDTVTPDASGLEKWVVAADEKAGIMGKAVRLALDLPVRKGVSVPSRSVVVRRGMGLSVIEQGEQGRSVRKELGVVANILFRAASNR